MNDGILVTGATGRVGGQVVARLRAAGHRVRALTRDPSSAAPRPGVDYVAGDLADPDSMTAALAGVDRVFLVFPTLRADHAAPALVDTIAEHARKIVYLSAAGAGGDAADREPGIIGSHSRMERLIENSGLEWTFLRPSGFASNTLGWASQIRAGDVLRWVYGDAMRALIHEADIADVGALAVTEPGHDRRRYHLTGPTRLTQIEQLRAIGAALGRDLRYEEVPADEAKSRLFSGMPEEMVDSILAGQALFVDRPEPVTDTVQQVTGIPARTFATWAADNADAFQ